jgi:hypothetical protein
VDDLRQAAATRAALAITAMTRSDTTCVPLAAIEAGIDAAPPFWPTCCPSRTPLLPQPSRLRRAVKRSRLIRRLWKRADRNPYAYLRLLERPIVVEIGWAGMSVRSAPFLHAP